MNKHPLIWNADTKNFAWKKKTFPWNNKTFSCKDALAASGQLLGDNWLIVDELMKDNPITVRRKAIYIPTMHSHLMNVSSRKYIPKDDVTVALDGSLFYIVPEENSFVIIRVSP